MNKREVIDALIKKTGCDKATITKVYPAIFELITDTMKKKEDFKVDGFGVFKLKISKAHDARNPATGAIVKVPAKAKVAFRPAKSLKEAMPKVK